ncbi:MAG: PilZ domain-containing protein, partial [Myxococcota bacterium]|nr:PilZ domain-containing protein [Myxococcota bacterium]
VVAPPKRMAALHAAIASLGPNTVADGYAPPENVLFLTNELLSRRGVDQRATPRVLYGTAVAFRAAGREEDEIGFSYNVSAGGVYVRTLDPLDAGQEVWLEMWPPRSERRVRLAGAVAWKRGFGPSDGATVPSGFGVKITDGLAGDLARWESGYRSFADSVLGSRSGVR